MGFIRMGEFGLIAMILTVLVGYFVANALFSYFIIKDKTLGDFPRILLVVLFWVVPFSGFVIYPVHWLVSKRQLA